MTDILVINPNSSDQVTQSMDQALSCVRSGISHDVRCITLPDGPPAIETAQDVQTVIPLVATAARKEVATAFVIACFSDPGVMEARAGIDRPVIGIGEAAYVAALTLGDRFGVISILETSVTRHAQHIARLGLSSRLAGDRAIGFGVASLSGDKALDAIIRTGRRLRDEDGASSVILGCAGMGGYRSAAEAALGIPVIDPVQAAVILASNSITLGYPNRRLNSKR